ICSNPHGRRRKCTNYKKTDMEHEYQTDTEKASLTSSPSYADFAAPSAASSWNASQGFLNWGASICFALLTPLLFLLVYGGLVDMSIFAKIKSGQMTAPIMLLQLIGTFGGQILSLILSWMIVTGMGKRSFGEALGLSWPPQFKAWHALVLGVGMFAFSALLMNLLPRQETDMDKFLKFGLSVRLVLALVATIGAPIHEEIVYRGVLYGGLERAIGMRGAVVIVSLLFWSVHVVQYWQSIATLVAVLLLSFVLTALRAWSGKLLPCVATHLFFNGIQGILIVIAPEKAVTPEPATQSAMLLFPF
ncbi:MAG TPA: CPBP family intramembrane glutamic endopeptidase, partial [Blastocatellia bacterium]|nr:CPBP family intramembrane glutamic endopeptidase [Blastocatellia bacterium]